MKVLVACEYSGTVRDAFIRKGHDAISCDLLPSESDFGPHYQGDVFDIIGDGFDLMIAHPPCTYLCRHRSRWNKAEDLKHQYEARAFFNRFIDADIEKICVENPVPLRAIGLDKYDQIIQPYHHGHDHSKKTCLWLKNLPLLEKTNEVELTYYTTPNGKRYTKGWYFTPRTSIARSRTFKGIADAMAEQWGQL